MRIVHLCEVRWNSAVAEFVLQTGLSLKQESLAFIVKSHSPLAHRLRIQQLPTVECSLGFFLMLIKLFNLIFRMKPDYLFVYGGREAFFAVILKFFFRFKIVRLVIDDRAVQRIPVLKKYASWIDTFIFPSPELARKAQSFGLRAYAVTLGFDKIFRSRPTFLPVYSRPILLIFGRFDPVKGQKRAIEIFAKVLKNWNDTPRPQLRIVGRSANLTAQDLISHTQRFGLSQADVSIEEVDVKDVSALLSSATLGWVSSLGSEIIARVTQEFQLCGTPVIVSEVGTLPEYLISIRPNCSYSLTNSDDDIANKIIIPALRFAIEHPEVAQTLVAAAHDRFLHHHMRQEFLKVLR